MPKDVLANWVLGNHDNPRYSTRLGEGRMDLFTILLQTLPGNAVTYYVRKFRKKFWNRTNKFSPTIDRVKKLAWLMARSHGRKRSTHRDVVRVPKHMRVIHVIPKELPTNGMDPTRLALPVVIRLGFLLLPTTRRIMP